MQAARALALGALVSTVALLGAAAPAAALAPSDPGYDGAFIQFVSLHDGHRQVLQETNETYAHHSSARNVIVSANDIPESEWRLTLAGEDAGGSYYRIVNRATGNALQLTHELTGWTASGDVSFRTYNVVTTPAYWNNDYQQWYVLRDPATGSYVIRNRAGGFVLVLGWRRYLSIDGTTVIGAASSNFQGTNANWLVTRPGPVETIEFPWDAPRWF